MGVCTSKKNANFGRLGSNRSINVKSLTPQKTNDYKIDLLQHQIKAPPNITSPSVDDDIKGNLDIDDFKPQQKRKNGQIRDPFATLANGTIKSDLLICGFIRESLHCITQQKLIPKRILHSVKQIYFPRLIAIEIGACNQSFYSTFNISHLLSSPNDIHYNGPNDECYVSTIHHEVLCADQEPRTFHPIKFFQRSQHNPHCIDFISHGISNKHLFISTVHPHTSHQRIYCFGKNQFGQCAAEKEKSLNQWTEIQPFWDRHISVLNMNEPQIIVDIKCGQYHTIFLGKSGKVWSCGQNWNAQLGLGMQIREQREPAPVTFVVRYSTETDVTVTPLSPHGVQHINYGFPAGNIHGISTENLFETQETEHEAASLFEESVRIKRISCGDSHNLCVDEFGELWIFGHMAIHSNMKEPIYEPIKHPYFALANQNEKKEDIRIARINCGADHSVCCDTNGLCYLFGTNDKGQIGRRYMDNHYEPHVFQHSTDAENKNRFQFEEVKIKDVEAGQCHTVLLTRTNDLITFGSNRYRQCSTVMQDDIIFFGHMLLRHEELGITSETYIERVLASANSTIIVVNLTKKLKVIR